MRSRMLYPCVMPLLAVMLVPVPTQADFAAPGPYEVGVTTVSVPRPGGGAFDALLAYPATASGPDTPFDTSGAPYPAICFGHGFVTPATRYQSMLDHLASWGYVVIAPRSWESLFPLPDHAAYADDFSSALNWLTDVNADPGSPYHAGIDTDAFGASGHSMGGGASILAAAQDVRIRAVGNLAAADTDPSAIAAIAGVDVPVRLLAGDDDTIAPPPDHQVPMFGSANAPRQLTMILGGFHCGFLDSPILFCDSGAISREAQLEITRRQLTAFFELYLRGDQGAWRLVWGPEYFANANLDTSATDAGIGVSVPSGTQSAAVGRDVAYTLTITNTGAQPSAYAIFAEDNAWTTTIMPTTTAPLAPGASADITVSVAVGAGGAAEDTVLVSARAQRDGGTRAYITLATTRIDLGDLNCDGLVTAADIDPFVLALTGGPSGYSAAYPECDFFAADCNQDGTVSSADIDGFVGLLVQ
jgi:dienelactone hydrolase